MALCLQPLIATAAVTFSHDFAPQTGYVAPVEKPYREELCLNGRWQFQPVSVPAQYERDRGVPPVLPLPNPKRWEETPLKIPSPWNVNTWGGGRNVGVGTSHPYWPSSVYYPSYPASWDGVEMGWMRRTFRLPEGWNRKRLRLRFEAVAGEAQVWINGYKVGDHFDSYTPFEFDVTRRVRTALVNEIWVGVRRRHLFNKTDPRYPRFRAPYPIGSNTDALGGIWQDVFLLALPEVRVVDSSIRPQVDRDRLEVEVSLANEGDRAQTLTVGGEVKPWVNRAGSGVLQAPIPHSRLGPTVLALPAVTREVPPGDTVRLTLQVPVKGRLKHWSPDEPHLYGLTLSVTRGSETRDRQYTRFGWRQFKIQGRDLLLNGKRIQLFGDLVHPFGAFVMSRRYAWAWYRMVKEVGGNAVRLHAQPLPRFYLDLADEMGMIVLDETALFGSSLQLNFSEPVAWERFAEHYDALVRRDRNHPSVYGWSFGNELFAIFEHNRVSEEQATTWYAKLAELGKRAWRLDPTRDWISSSGDGDLRGTMPVWMKHMGHGLHLEALPGLNKPLVIAESGGTYYATPPRLAEFNGERAYESYRGRNEALAIDLYQNVAKMARPMLTSYSASEIVWFGLEPLNFGYSDFTRLPHATDGVFFTKPFAEGAPGWQPERLPPYVSTLNPGWDPGLPLYKPLPMFEAMKAALAPGGPAPSPWDHRPPVQPKPAPAPPTITQVGFVGPRPSDLYRQLVRWGVPVAEDAVGTDMKLLLIDGGTLEADTIQQVRKEMEAVMERGGTAMVLLGGEKFPLEAVNRLLPAPIELSSRHATMLAPKGADPWIAPFGMSDLYFAEDPIDPRIMKRGLSGPFTRQGEVLLEAANIDWSLFGAGENVKVGALALYERLEKPDGDALVVKRLKGGGRLAVSAIDTTSPSPAFASFWRRLFTNMGVKLNESQEDAVPAFVGDTLVNAMSTGRFGATDLNAALAKDFLGESVAEPRKGGMAGGLTWRPVTSPSKDRFVLHDLEQEGPEDAFAVYFSFWIRSPRALDDLLSGGPDVPRLGLQAFLSKRGRLFLNGREITPEHQSPADYRTLYTYEGLPLRKGWNHFLIKVVSDQLEGDRPATLAVRLFTNNAAYLREMRTAIEINTKTISSRE